MYAARIPLVVLFTVLVMNNVGLSQQKKEVTLHGEIVDVISFVSSGAAKGTEEVRKSALSGNPLGFYDTGKKKLYLVGVPEMNKAANERLLPYIGIRVFVIGKVYTRNGVDLILISDIGKSIK